MPDFLWNLDPPGRAAALGQAGQLLRRQAAATPVINWNTVRPVRGGSSQTLCPGAVTRIDQSVPLQLGKCIPINVGPAALIDWLIVPVQSQPLQIPHHLVTPGLSTTVRIQVLQPQHHASAPAPGGQPGQQCRPEVSQVHPPTGTGGESAAHRFVLLCHICQGSPLLHSFAPLYHGPVREKSAARAFSRVQLLLFRLWSEQFAFPDRLCYTIYTYNEKNRLVLRRAFGIAWYSAV